MTKYYSPNKHLKCCFLIKIQNKQSDHMKNASIWKHLQPLNPGVHYSNCIYSKHNKITIISFSLNVYFLVIKKLISCRPSYNLKLYHVSNWKEIRSRILLHSLSGTLVGCSTASLPSRSWLWKVGWPQSWPCAGTKRILSLHRWFRWKHMILFLVSCFLVESNPVDIMPCVF